MRETSQEFTSELRISTRTVVIPLFAAGIILVFIRNPLAEHPFVQFAALPLGLLLLAGGGIALLLESWRPWAGRWWVIGLLVGIVVLAHSMVTLPGELALLAIPTALTAAMLGLLSAIGVAAGETVLVLLLIRNAPGADETLGIALTAIWGIVGVMAAIYYPIRRFSEWSWECYRANQALLDEARDRKAELEQALADMAHLNRQLALMNERVTMLRLAAEDAQAAKSRFVMRVSHELRAPLNIIIGLIRLAMENPDAYAEEIPPDLKRDLEVVYRNCQHVASMINDVLDLSQAEAGSITLHRQQVRIAEVIESALAIVRPLIERKGLRLSIEIPSDLPDVFCDPVRIRQVILNLLTNAVRLTERGGVAIHVYQEGQGVVVGVQDTGPGIPPEDIKRIFEPFYASSSHLTREEGGSGLGLSISKQFVELHKGQMWCESEVGKGSTFYFRLPISVPPQPVARPGHQIKEEWIWRERISRNLAAILPSALYRRSRFIIYDEVGSLYSELTEHTDTAEFVHVTSKEQLMNELKECPAHAIIVNAEDADNLLRRVYELSRCTSGIPVLGCSLPHGLASVRAAGVKGYLTKPIGWAELEQVFREAGKPVKHVLIVDDDEDFLSLIHRLLNVNMPTLKVSLAASGEQALQKISGSQPDLILLDLIMPDMSGWNLLERLRGNGTTRDIPVYIVSAQDLDDQPTVSKVLVAATEGGLSPIKLLCCSLIFSKVLLEPDSALDQMLG